MSCTRGNKTALKIALLSCSKSQLKYFQRLTRQLAKDNFAKIELLNYKKINKAIRNVLRIWCPKVLSDNNDVLIKEQVDLYIRRKKNTSSGQKKPQWYWVVCYAMQYRIALYYFLHYQTFFQHKNYSHLILWNGNKFHQAIVKITAHECCVECLYMEIGPLPGFMQVSRLGVNAGSKLPQNADFYNQCCMKTINDLSMIRENSGEELTAFIPFQVVEDSNIYCYSPWIINMRHFYDELVVCAEQYPQITFLLKEHPKCDEKYEDLKGKHPRIKFESPSSSIPNLLTQSDFVVTINSTVGVEALMRFKPLITLGDAIYNIDGVVQTARTTEQLSVSINNILEGWQPNKSTLQGYFNYLRNQYAVEGEMNNPTDEQLSMMSQKIQQLVGQSKPGESESL